MADFMSDDFLSKDNAHDKPKESAPPLKQFVVCNFSIFELISELFLFL